jgi:NTE family protein
VEALISLTARDILRVGRSFLGGDTPRGTAYGHGGFLDTTGLEKFVVGVVPWRGIRRNLLSGNLRALAVSATHVGTGRTVVFVDSASPIAGPWSRDPHVRHQPVAIGPRHALASASIPMLFPAVKVAGQFYVDGGLRQNTPMSPAIRLGANRLLVISLRHNRTQAEDDALAADREAAFPKPLFLAGKALNALLLDHTDNDLDRMGQLNAIIEAGRKVYGEGFVSAISRELAMVNRPALRTIDAVHVRPSQDIGVLASDFVSQGRVKMRSRVTSTLMRRMAESEASHESDLLSYVLFDGDFASDLIDMGYRDASAQEEALVELFAGVQ